MRLATNSAVRRNLAAASRDEREDTIEDLRKLVDAARCAADCAEVGARDQSDLADLQNALHDASDAIERMRGRP